MLHKWCEILPLFVVRILAKRSCGTTVYDYGVGQYKFAIARPDVLIKL